MSLLQLLFFEIKQTSKIRQKNCIKYFSTKYNINIFSLVIIVVFVAFYVVVKTIKVYKKSTFTIGVVLSFFLTNQLYLVTPHDLYILLPHIPKNSNKQQTSIFK